MKAHRRPRKAAAVSPASRRPRLRDRWLGWISSRRVVLLFAAKFVAFLAVLHVLALAPWFDRSLPAYLHAVACGANWLAHLAGETSEVTGSTLRAPAFGVTVAPECSALEFVRLLTAVMLAFPASWRARALGIALAVCWCVLLNVLRVASLLLVGIHAPSLFALAHEELWAVLLILSATLFVAAWIHWQAGADAPTANPHDGHAAA
ncbi:MAG: archaeosortase/exosortase family protein [Chthoniobacter sp.]|nr:archaeosortase/exosortase family protein [Chthoniobacter sp.]